MRETCTVAAAAGVLFLGLAGAARADDAAPGDRSPREIQAALDAYLVDAPPQASLVAGGGSAGYDGAFWVRGGDFGLAVGAEIETRWEGFDWDDREFEPSPGGDLSGFSLPRTTLRLAGSAPCCMTWCVDLEFGHAATPRTASRFSKGQTEGVPGFTIKYETDRLWRARTGWIGWGGRDEQTDLSLVGLGPDDGGESDSYRLARFLRYDLSGTAFGLEMGLVPMVGPRQLMTSDAYQQFVDVSLGAAWIGAQMPGFVDRNRDIGVRFHGGNDSGTRRFNWMAAITNGDDFWRRNVLDGFTDDHVAFSGRVDFGFGTWQPHFTEGALTMRRGQSAYSIGVWGYTLHAVDAPDRWCAGVDLQAKWGGITYTGAYSYAKFEEKDFYPEAYGWSGYWQAGVQIPDTPWEVVGRVSMYWEKGDYGAVEYSAGFNYAIDGNRNRVQVDVTRIVPTDDGNYFSAPYPGYNPTYDSDAWLVRAGWQYIF